MYICREKSDVFESVNANSSNKCISLKNCSLNVNTNQSNKCKILLIQSNLSYVTFQEKIEIWSHKTGGH
jgi:hypothetical protein